MYDRAFFSTRLGFASLASIAAMTALVALSTQVTLGAGDAGLAETMDRPAMIVELA
ncbi:MAG: hypothetical protein WA985_02640 [Erythrobacter sp.]|uniref:hypothetical protein n=1 Tax=Erythrobacter sp. TaxID=1042 RepID=UPI003C742FED